MQKDSLRATLHTTQQQLLVAQDSLRKHAHEASKASSQLTEARGEVQRLKEERKSLSLQLTTQGPTMGDNEDKLAWQQDLRGKLDRSEQHREEVARKLGKARKHQQNLLAQYETEIELYTQRLEQMEEELGEEMEARLNKESACAQAEAQLDETRRELNELRERQTRRALIQPGGLQELQDELEMAEEVRATLCANLSNLTDELVQVKLSRAQEQDEREVLEQRLRRSTDKQRAIALRMTELEVRLADVNMSYSENEEKISTAFKDVMQQQEGQIRDLREQLAALQGTVQGGKCASTPSRERAAKKW